MKINPIKYHMETPVGSHPTTTKTKPTTRHKHKKEKMGKIVEYLSTALSNINFIGEEKHIVNWQIIHFLSEWVDIAFRSPLQNFFFCFVIIFNFLLSKSELIAQHFSCYISSLNFRFGKFYRYLFVNLFFKLYFITWAWLKLMIIYCAIDILSRNFC